MHYFCSSIETDMRYIGSTLAILILVLHITACNGQGVSAEESEKVAALEGLPRIDYADGHVTFSLAEIEGLKQVSKDSVPWAMYMAETDSNGQLGYFFYPGYKIELASPQIRIEFMHRGLKGCSSADSLFTWLKSVFMTPERKGVVVGESNLGSLDGQVIKMLEMETPDYRTNDTMQYSGKRMAWAYAENGDRLIGFAYSAITQDDYQQGLPQFMDLVRSYKDNQE
jgi:hypothetical protein